MVTKILAYLPFNVGLHSFLRDLETTYVFVPRFAPKFLCSLSNSNTLGNPVSRTVVGYRRTRSLSGRPLFKIVFHADCSLILWGGGGGGGPVGTFVPKNF